MVRQRRQQEVVRIEVLQQQARRIRQVEVPLEDAADQGLRQPLGGCRADELVQRLVQGGTEPGGGGQLVLDELPGTRLVQGLGQQLVKKVHLHALVPQLLREGVVLLLCTLSPHHVVEQQVVDIARRQPHEFQAGPMHDHLLEDADLGVNMERHGSPHFFAGASYCGTDCGGAMWARCAR